MLAPAQGRLPREAGGLLAACGGTKSVARVLRSALRAGQVDVLALWWMVLLVGHEAALT